MIFRLRLFLSRGIATAAMARKLRVLFEGAIYHVTVRGMERRRLFRDDADRERFVTRLGAQDQWCADNYEICGNGWSVTEV